KYLNSPETPVFHKGRELYGLWQAQKAIRAHNRVLIVEGYMDVVALHQYGVENVVATLGTATTEQHITRLFRLADEVVFSFDGDKAGQRAAWRALENAFAHLQDGKQVRFLFLPQEHDPDSYLREHGLVAFEAALREADTLSQYWLRTLLKQVSPEGEPLHTVEQKAAFAAAAKPYLESLNAPLLRAALVSEVAQASGLPEELLQQDLPPITPVSSMQVAASRSAVEVDHAQANDAPYFDTSNIPASQTQARRRPPILGRVRNQPRTVLSLPAQMLQMLLQDPLLAVKFEPEKVQELSTDALLLKQVLSSIHHASEIPKHAAAVRALLDPAIHEALSEIELRDIDHELDKAELESKWTAACKQLLLQQDRALYEQQLAQGQVDTALFERLFSHKRNSAGTLEN
ncbi:MAG: hypothetical protein RLZZ502_83, partial [Pseudomonadota bacterium]